MSVLINAEFTRTVFAKLPPGAAGALYRSSRTRVGSRWVEFVCPAQVEPGLQHNFLAIWSPDGPPRRWKASHLELYRKARDAFQAELAKALGFQPIVIDSADLDRARVETLELAAQAILAARAAGVTVDRTGIHGDPELVSAWEPALRPHAAGIDALLAARPQR